MKTGTKLMIPALIRPNWLMTIPLALGLAGTGCASDATGRNAPAAGSMPAVRAEAAGQGWICEAFAPIRFDGPVPDALMLQIEEHNAVWSVLCEEKVGG